MKNAVLSVIAICVVAVAAQAQQAPGSAQPRAGGQARGGGQAPSTAREDGLDPTPVGANDPNIDMFIGDYRNSKPHAEYGKLAFRDILTKLDSPDAVRPTRKGAVLTNITSISYATLAPGATASGREQKGNRQIFFATAGAGKLTVNAKSYDIKDGTGFTLTPDFDFSLTSTGKEPLSFYVRAEPLPAAYTASPEVVVVNRFDGDRRVGAHWVHICNGGPSGMTLCTIAPHTMPQPHSHPMEEVWIMVKGESILSLGKNLRRMIPGQSYKIPPTGVTAHSNLNMNEEPVEMIYMGPAGREPAGPVPPGGFPPPGGGAPGTVQAPAPGGGPPAKDFARLDNASINAATEQDVDMYMGNWHDAFPHILHGNLYFRDMLTALQGPDPLHPVRKGAVLTNAEAVSYVMLEPGAFAHPVNGELKGIQQSFVVNSGTGSITAGGKTFQLSKGKAFIITPGLDFRMTATGDHYMTFYVVSEKLAEGFTPQATLQVVDNTSRPQLLNSWVNKERALLSKGDGLSQYGALTQVELPSMSMSRPYSAAEGVEEIWIATEGDGDMLFGKGLRKLPAGTAYRVPPTGKTAHANINVTGSTETFLYMVKGG